jgi:hypothetical protein
VVTPAQFVHRAQAKRELGLRIVGTVNMRLSHRHLVPAITSPDSPELGVTRDSLDAEIAWWKHANTRARVRRHLETILSNF